MIPVSEVPVIQPAWSAYFPLITAGGAVVGALSVALIGVWSNFKGHEKTREREEAARLKREKREAAATALAAFRDMRTAQRARKAAADAHRLEAGHAQTAWQRRRQLDQAIDDLYRKLRGDPAPGKSESFRLELAQLEAQAAALRPEWERIDARERELIENEKRSQLELEQAIRQVQYARAILEMTFPPEIAIAYWNMFDADDEAAEGILVGAFTFKVREDIEGILLDRRAKWKPLAGQGSRNASGAEPRQVEIREPSM